MDGRCGTQDEAQLSYPVFSLSMWIGMWSTRRRVDMGLGHVQVIPLLKPDGYGERASRWGVEVEHAACDLTMAFHEGYSVSRCHESIASRSCRRVVTRMRHS